MNILNIYDKFNYSMIWLIFCSLNLVEIVEELEKEIETDFSSDESDGWEQFHEQIKTKPHEIEVFISPPDDGAVTDEDSGDEGDVEMRNLPGNQLLSEASRSNGQKIVPEKNAHIRSKKRKTYHWNKSDLQDINYVPSYPYKPSSSNLPRSPLEVFYLFFDDDVLQFLIEKTNGYAKFRGNHSFNVTNEEMKVFIGILLISGYVTVPRRRMFWQVDSAARNEMIANAMRRNRFEEIFRFIHGADNSNLIPNDKFSKVKPFVNMLNDRFLRYGTVFGANNVSIDESMIPYYGRHPTKQFIRSKPIRWGYKAWVAADPRGYAYHVDLYQGKSESTNKHKEDFGLGGAVILSMIDRLEEEFPETKFSLYFDNYFTSVRLIEEITRRGHFATGTLRSNRVEKCPFMSTKQFEKKNRGFSEHFSNADRTIVLARWNDNGIVTIASNEHGVFPLARTEIFSTIHKKKISIEMPHLIKMYNSHMGGVDRMDQNVSLYRIHVRGKKWYIPILWYFINLAVNNAWIFARDGCYKGDLLEFHSSIAEELVKTSRAPSLSNRYNMLVSSNSKSSEKRYDNVGHTISKGSSRRRCRVCNSQTIYECVKCEVPLHTKCTVAFHFISK